MRGNSKSMSIPICLNDRSAVRPMYNVKELNYQCYNSVLTVCCDCQRETLVPVTNAQLAEKIVKVPEMAESITEGTLKQWSKRKLCKPCDAFPFCSAERY